MNFHIGGWEASGGGQGIKSMLRTSYMSVPLSSVRLLSRLPIERFSGLPPFGRRRRPLLGGVLSQVERPQLGGFVHSENDEENKSGFSL